MIERLPKPVPDTDPDGPSGRQIQVLLGGGLLGAVLLAASLVIDFSGANNVSVPQMPKLPSQPTSFPTNLPSGFPTNFPGLPTASPSLPGLPGGGS